MTFLAKLRSALGLLSETTIDQMRLVLFNKLKEVLGPLPPGIILELGVKGSRSPLVLGDIFATIMHEDEPWYPIHLQYVSNGGPGIAISWNGQRQGQKMTHWSQVKPVVQDMIKNLAAIKADMEERSRVIKIKTEETVAEYKAFFEERWSSGQVGPYRLSAEAHVITAGDHRGGWEGHMLHEYRFEDEYLRGSFTFVNTNIELAVDGTHAVMGDLVGRRTADAYDLKRVYSESYNHVEWPRLLGGLKSAYPLRIVQRLDNSNYLNAELGDQVVTWLRIKVASAIALILTGREIVVPAKPEAPEWKQSREILEKACNCELNGRWQEFNGTGHCDYGLVRLAIELMSDWVRVRYWLADREHTTDTWLGGELKVDLAGLKQGSIISLIEADIDDQVKQTTR